MKQRIKKYYQQIVSLLQRYWLAVKGIEYKKVFTALFELMEIFPGLMAWVVEVVSLGSAVICIFVAARQSYELAFWQAFGLITLAGMLIGIAILSDHYTRPTEAKHGGGD